MARKRWAELSPATRRLVTVAASVEGILKIAALIDLARRPSDQIRGTKTGAVIAKDVPPLTVVSGAGHVERKHPEPAPDSRL